MHFVMSVLPFRLTTNRPYLEGPATLLVFQRCFIRSWSNQLWIIWIGPKRILTVHHTMLLWNGIRQYPLATYFWFRYEESEDCLTIDGEDWEGLYGILRPPRGSISGTSRTGEKWEGQKLAWSESSKFHNWPQECKRRSVEKTKAWDIHSLLIKPVQRVLKYPLLLQELLHVTPNSYDDFTALELATKEITKVAERINESKRRYFLVIWFLNLMRQEGNLRSSPCKGTKDGVEYQWRSSEIVRSTDG